jgi:hypothetical protein
MRRKLESIDSYVMEINDHLKREDIIPRGIIQGQGKTEFGNVPWGIKVDYISSEFAKAQFVPEGVFSEFSFEYIGTAGYAIRDIRIGQTSITRSANSAIIRGTCTTPTKIGNIVFFELVRV